MSRERTFTLEKIRETFTKTFAARESWNDFFMNLTAESCTDTCGFCEHPDCAHNASGRCETIIELPLSAAKLCQCWNQRLSS